MTNHCLYLLPSPINDEDVNWSIPSFVIDQITKIQCFIVENEKTSRRFLKQINPNIIWADISIFELNKHNLNSDQKELSVFLRKNLQVGLLSEAGMPCIADPGNHIVRMAHDLGIQVKPLVGPSSILLALISSGLNGQSFKFNGYLPSKPDARKQSIIAIERESRVTSQWFIEAPYRNNAMFNDLVNVLHPETRLALAMDIGGINEKIFCKKVSYWKQVPIDIGKIPCMFGIGN